MVDLDERIAVHHPKEGDEALPPVLEFGEKLAKDRNGELGEGVVDRKDSNEVRANDREVSTHRVDEHVAGLRPLEESDDAQICEERAETDHEADDEYVRKHIHIGKEREYGTSKGEGVCDEEDDVPDVEEAIAGREWECFPENVSQTLTEAETDHTARLLHNTDGLDDGTDIDDHGDEGEKDNKAIHYNPNNVRDGYNK